MCYCFLSTYFDPSINLSIQPSIYLYEHLFNHLLIYLSTNVSIYLFITLLIHPYIHISIGNYQNALKIVHQNILDMFKKVVMMIVMLIMMMIMMYSRNFHSIVCHLRFYCMIGPISKRNMVTSIQCPHK